MAMRADDIRDLLAKTFPQAQIEILDLAGDGNHYKAIITSAQFTGLSRVAQHQLVYAALKGAMDGTNDAQLHALALETKPPS
ncbi:BolA/IbaG family iron-sulfur metabolism protein [Robiginitomaculum antarcticum]|uniref:BolA/IbaG family iron-sulfur metabolism protein n=1 Tax=Robiginitomaculum antarcticum TaxID=437507 RepID=UPI00035E9C7A|nr:BolA family transcriptional regulator [Robiginitomaculum antarcticum]